MSDPTSLITAIIAAFDPGGAGTTQLAKLTGWPTSTIHSFKANGNIPDYRRREIVRAAYEAPTRLPAEYSQPVPLTGEMLDYLDPEREVRRLPPVGDVRGPHSAASAPETSALAAESIRTKAPKLRDRVEMFARERGAEGFIDEDLYAHMADKSENSVRPRRSELVDANVLIDTGRRRNNAAGRSCAIWIHREFA